MNSLRELDLQARAKKANNEEKKCERAHFLGLHRYEGATSLGFCLPGLGQVRAWNDRRKIENMIRSGEAFLGKIILDTVKVDDKPALAYQKGWAQSLKKLYPDNKTSLVEFDTKEYFFGGSIAWDVKKSTLRLEI